MKLKFLFILLAFSIDSHGQITRDFSTPHNLRNSNYIAKKGEKVYISSVKKFYAYEQSDLSSSDDGYFTIVQGNKRWKCVGCTVYSYLINSSDTIGYVFKNGNRNDTFFLPSDAGSYVAGQRPWVKVGNSSETSATSVLSTDNIFHTGKVTIGSSNSPTGLLQVGNSNNINSTKPGIVLNKIANTTGVSEHGICDNSTLINSMSYNSFDARIDINTTIGGNDPHYVAFQAIPKISNGVTVPNYFGLYDKAQNTTGGTITNYFSVRSQTPLGVGTYVGLDILGENMTATSATGMQLLNMVAPSAYGINISGVNGSTISNGIRVANMAGTNPRPIYTRHSTSFQPNELNYSNSGSSDLLMFSRGSVSGNEELGMVWEAGSGATKYYSNRFSGSFDPSLRGNFIFSTNHTGGSTLAALTEKARIQYDGSFIHQGYHQYTSTFATTGVGVPNGSVFKGTNGALYYKGGSGTVTMLAPN